jgi:hypothetical protein
MRVTITIHHHEGIPSSPALVVRSNLELFLDLPENVHPHVEDFSRKALENFWATSGHERCNAHCYQLSVTWFAHVVKLHIFVSRTGYGVTM